MKYFARRRARLNNRAGRMPGAGLFTRAHGRILRLSGGRLGARWSGVPVLVLESIGRRSGRRRTVPLVYINDGDRRVVLPAAAGAERTPSWWVNLQADPRAIVYLDGGIHSVRAHRADADEYVRLWRHFARVYPDIDDFAAYTTRSLPLVILEPDHTADRLTVGGSRSHQLGRRRWATTRAGDIAYRATGSGPTLVFVHGLWVNGDVWRQVVPKLADSYRCVTPDWPFGAHATGLGPDAELSPEAVADVMADLIDTLSTDEVTVIANDTGVAYTQVLLTRHPEKITRVVLTPGDVGRNFLPWAIKWMRAMAYIPTLLTVLAHFWNSHAGRTAIMAPLAQRRPSAEVLDSWFQPAATDPALRRDLVKLLRDATPRATTAALHRLHEFAAPVLIAWTFPPNIVFSLRDARRLHRVLPNSSIRLIDHSFAFVSEDQPQQLADIIRDFVPGRHVATRFNKRALDND